MNLVIDIETIPCDQEARKRLSPILPPRNLKDPAKIKKWEEENASALEEEQYKRTALDASLGRIICIGLQFFTQSNDAHNSISIYGGQEEKLLSKFWSVLQTRSNPYIITHNGLSFDLPFIWKRSVILRVPPSMVFNLTRYRTDRTYDTMAVWSNWDMRDAIKLDHLARALGVAGKSGSGADVYDLWRDGKYREIAAYCLQDVYVTYCCYCRMNFIEPVDRSDIASELIQVE